MAIQSKIKWTESTWNPVRGRPRVSEMKKNGSLTFETAAPKLEYCSFSSSGEANGNQKQVGSWMARLTTRCRAEHLPNPASRQVILKLWVNRPRAMLQKQISCSTLLQDVRYESNGTSL